MIRACSSNSNTIPPILINDYFVSSTNFGKIWQSLAFGFLTNKDIRTGVPNPVTGSHPFVIGKPAVPQLEAFPAVTSVNPLYPLEYNHGFKKPSGGLPQAIRSSFRREMMLADNGVDADVPEMDEKV
jgi:hypothetical protein